MLKNSMVELSPRSTSVNTAPNPLTEAGMLPLVPGTENVASVILLPMGVKSRFGLKVEKAVAYVGLIKSRLSRPPVGAACVKPVPGVVNVAPRVF